MNLLSVLLKTLMADGAISALAKKTGWSQINPGSDRWSVSRYSSNSAWYYIDLGIAGNGGFFYTFTVSAVSAFTLND